MPQGYQPQGQYLIQGFQQPSGQPSFQGAGNLPLTYQPYIQPGHGPSYIQPSTRQYPRMNMLWDPSQIQQTMQPNVQLLNQPGQPLVSGPTQQPIQTTIQTLAPSSIQQSAPSTPQNPPQTVATTATSVQPITPVSRVSVAPVSSIPASMQIPQVFVPLLAKNKVL